METVALIPAYNPSEQFVSLVRGLAAANFSGVIVVNDGSEPESDRYFNEIRTIDKVCVLRHAVNLGKGAALKTGMNHAYCNFENLLGVVTVDADGQHLVEDAVRVSDVLRQNPESLVMGARAFDGAVPLRSKIGNAFTVSILSGLSSTTRTTGLPSIVPTGRFDAGISVIAGDTIFATALCSSLRFTSPFCISS